MDKKTLEEQWIEYVKQWNHERFGVAEYLGGRQKTLEETMGYMVAIDEYLEEENITFPFEQTYSSQGKTEFQNLVYLVERTAQVLGHPFLCSIIYDGFNIEHGKEDLLGILGRYINWIDISA